MGNKQFMTHAGIHLCGIFVIVTTHPWPLLRLSAITEIYSSWVTATTYVYVTGFANRGHIRAIMNI